MRSALMIVVVMMAVGGTVWSDTSGPRPPHLRGLVAYWPGDVDGRDVAGHHHGVLRNGSKVVAGIVGRAFYFDGVDDYVEIPDAPSLEGMTALTIEVWVKREGTGTGIIVAKYSEATPNQRGYLFYIRGVDAASAPNRVALELFADPGTADSPQIGLLSNTLYTDSEWHHLAATYDGSRVKIFIDGVLDADNAYSGGVCANTVPVTIGILSDLKTCPFNGLIDEVRVYNRALSASEIIYVYHAGSLGKVTSKRL